LKRVRPREKLKKLAKKPEIYNRKQVDLECFEAIDQLMNLRTCPDLKTTKELDCYPSPEAIQKVRKLPLTPTDRCCDAAQLELLYGDALSKEDLDGTLPSSGSIAAGSLLSFSSESHSKDHLENSFLSSPSAFLEMPSTSPHSGGGGGGGGRSRRLEATDSHNHAFEEIIRSRDPNVPRIDRLQEQRVSFPSLPLPPSSLPPSLLSCDLPSCLGDLLGDP
jgi:hypothetical protein